MYSASTQVSNALMNTIATMNHVNEKSSRILLCHQY